MFNKDLLNAAACEFFPEHSAPGCALRLDRPVNDALALQVVQGQGQLADKELHSVLLEADILLQVKTQVPSQQEVHHHEHVLLILEGVPATELDMDVRVMHSHTRESSRQRIPCRPQQSVVELRGQALGVDGLSLAPWPKALSFYMYKMGIIILLFDCSKE